jgi:hypothetical protein
MKPLVVFLCLVAGAATIAISGCGNIALPGAGFRVTSTHAGPARSFTQFDNAAQKHVLTWAWFKQGDHPAPRFAAPYLDWAAVNNPEANSFHAAGIKTVLYTDPNRTYPGEPMYTNDESTFAHDCAGHRITIKGRPGPTYQMDPSSPHLVQLWAAWVNWELKGGVHYDAIFDDDANSVHNTSALPCHFNQILWSQFSNSMNAALGKTLVYNGLGTLGDGIKNPPPALEVNPTTFGGMLEGCYNNITILDPVPKKDVWHNFETTELTMSNIEKSFVCRGLKTQPAQNSYAQRIYQYASFLLTYDPATSIISEKFTTPSNTDVFPEETFVALNPLVASPANVDVLKTSTWTYGRQYASCYVWGKYVGACAAVVNADAQSSPHAFPYPGVYAHTLVLSGAGILDGGTISTTGPPPRSTIHGASAVIAIH